MQSHRAALVVVLPLLLAARPAFAEGPPAALEVVARSEGRQWTGVAVSPGGRLFTNYPRWFGPHTSSVVEVLSDGGTRPFPDAEWNAWTPGSEKDPALHWVCVQSVTVDAKGRLWVLDPASPAFGGVVPGGAKLVRFDLDDGPAPPQVISLDETAAPRASYLNDVRVDVRRNLAWITDSGLGAILVVDLATGQARRLLADHPSTKADPTLVPRVGGRELKPSRPDGTAGDVHQVHADGIALDPRGEWLYWQALTGKRLFRAPVALLADPGRTPSEIAAAVQDLGETVVTDGLETDEAGNVYFTALERDAIVVRRPDGRLETLAQDPERLAWPDSLAWGPKGALYVATSQIHRTPMVHPNREMPTTPYWILRLALPPR